MKKNSLVLKLLITLLAVSALAIGYTVYSLLTVQSEKLSLEAQIVAIEAVPPAEVIVEQTYSKEIMPTVKVVAEEQLDEQVLCSLRKDNILFVSYSEEWDAEDLNLLYEELMQNVHGVEMEYLERVIVYGYEDDVAIGMHSSNDDMLTLPIRLNGTIPSSFKLAISNTSSVIELFNGDEYTTVEQMAITLSHEYGHHFTLYYFTLKGDTEKIEQDEYFNLRYQDGLGIRYTYKQRKDYDDYIENHQWFMIEIAADDYVYLMGSPNTRRTMDYYDSKETLQMSVRGGSALDRYYEESCENTFNSSPHENAAMPFPDQVDGLAELFYSTIGIDAPVYEDRTEQAEQIEISISRRSDRDHTYYNITWDKPWKSSDVLYTLVAYDENDKLIGAIKCIDGSETARALIGSPIVDSGAYYYWWEHDYWTSFDFVRFRVVVTFPDGTAVVSPAVDRNF